MTRTLADAFRRQGLACSALGSPFHGALAARAADDIEADGPAAAVMSRWREAPTEAIFADAAPLRWLGAWHDVALSEPDGALAAAFPAKGRAGDPQAAWSQIARRQSDLADRILAFVGHEPQTNEVARSACLLPGFLQIARRTGRPLRLIELGASAGLNQFWDRFAYDYGAAGRWGDPGSGVALTCDWRGPPADLSGDIRIVSRTACDRAPIDLRQPDERRRLAAYVWPDQLERLERLRAAVDAALAYGVGISQSDALDFVQAKAAPVEGQASVIYHSIFWQYLPADHQLAVSEAIAAQGASASVRAPLAWLRMEPAGANPLEISLDLTLWPGGETRRLARCHPHGAWTAWEPEGSAPT